MKWILKWVVLCGWSCGLALTVISWQIAAAAPADKTPSDAHGEAVKGSAGGKHPDSSLEKILGSDSSQSKSDEAAPVFIKSTTVNLDSKQRVFVYRDNVVITRGDLIITADVVTGKYNEANELETVVCEQNVVITRGETLKATSNRAVYDVKKDVIVLTENPELNDRGNILLADKVTVYVAQDRSEAEGQVRVKVNKTEGGGLMSAAASDDEDKKGKHGKKGAGAKEQSSQPSSSSSSDGAKN